ncbi:MAG TPA: DUF47 family protein [Sulfolobales archaeon]|nr:DUF47 family protein [Sulfolobales archaeon]
MAEEFINPYDMSRLSVAEMNLLEKMSSDSRILRAEIFELRSMLREVIGGGRGNPYAVKSMEEKIRKLKEDLQAEGFKTLEYLVRTGLGLSFKDIYAEIITGIIAVGESTADLSLYLGILGPGATIPSDIARSIESLAEVVEEEAKKFEELLTSLNINPKAASGNAAEIEKLEEQADEIYRALMPSIVKSLSKSPETMLPIMEIVERLEGISDTIWRLSIYLKYVAMHRV